MPSRANPEQSEALFMTSKTYRSIAYKQNDDEKTPWLISFVARAEDLRTWAGIPRRSEQGLVGFQRADEQRRVERAQEFFDRHAANQSPTSIVIGIHPPGEGAKRRVRLEFDEGETGDIRGCELTVDYEPDAPLAEVVGIIRSQIESRLVQDQVAIGSDEADEEAELEAPTNAEDATGDAEEDEDDEDDEEEEDGGGVTTPDEEIELGRSVLRDLLAKLEDEPWCQTRGGSS